MAASRIFHRLSVRALGLPQSINRRVLVFKRPLTLSTSKRAEAAATPASDSASSQSETYVQPQRPNTLRGIIDYYGGMYPLLGLGAAFVFTKELIIVNEEFLMSTNFAVFVLALYVVLGDSVANLGKDQYAETKRQMDALFDLNIDALEASKRAHQRFLNAPNVIQAYKKEYNELVIPASRADAVQKQLSARAAVEKRLAELVAREQKERAAQASTFVADAASFVRSRFSDDAALRAKALEGAFLTLSAQDGKDHLTEVVKQTYLEFLQKHNADEKNAGAEGQKHA